jgi:hypothetical protein
VNMPGFCLHSGDVITYNGTRQEQMPFRNRTGDVVDVWFQTGVPSADFEVITTGGSMFGAGCVNRKTLGDSSLTCLLCVTAAASGGSRSSLRCAAANAILQPLTVYRLTIQLSATIVGALFDAGGAAISNVSVATIDRPRGNIQVVRPFGPGYICLQQVQVANPTACSRNTFSSFNGSTACCSNCTDMTTGCSGAGQPCACPAGMILTGNSCGEAAKASLVSHIQASSHPCSFAVAGCPPGRFFSSQLVCATCLAGSFCVNSNMVRCPAGFFCPTNTSTPVACPAGTFSTGGATVCQGEGEGKQARRDVSLL